MASAATTERKAAARHARDFVDALGSLHQAVAAVCQRVTLMVAGCELRVKERQA